MGSYRLESLLAARQCFPNDIYMREILAWSITTDSIRFETFLEMSNGDGETGETAAGLLRRNSRTMGRDQPQQSIATIIGAALAYDGGLDRAAVLKWRRRDFENFIAILTPKKYASF
ncbi:hypothetical protein OROMI_010204 [Orobanche minor]